MPFLTFCTHPRDLLEKGRRAPLCELPHLGLFFCTDFLASAQKILAVPAVAALPVHRGLGSLLGQYVKTASDWLLVPEETLSYCIN
jgi:hypothetical protein